MRKKPGIKDEVSSENPSKSEMSDLGSLSEAMARHAADKRILRQNAIQVREEVEKEVPLTEKSLTLLERIDRLRELNSFSEAFGRGCEPEHMGTYKESLSVFHRFLNSITWPEEMEEFFKVPEENNNG
jgi:hypothetical protein